MLTLRRMCRKRNLLLILFVATGVLLTSAFWAKFFGNYFERRADVEVDEFHNLKRHLEKSTVGRHKGRSHNKAIPVLKVKKAEQKPKKIEDKKKSRDYPEISENNGKCGLNWKENTFKEKDDGYETLSLSAKEIHSTDFVLNRPASLPKPVFETPVIRLNSSRFMMPVLIRGPNNQLVGFRESVYVAIRLNRTFVIPRFVKHRSNSEKKYDNIHPGHRVDFDRVCQFISCVTMEQFRMTCGRKADVIFRLRHYSKKRIADLEAQTGTQFSINKSTKKINLLPPEPKNKKETYFKSSEIRTLFDSSERCAIYGQPFYSLKIKYKHSGRKMRTQSDLSRMSDSELFSEIIRQTEAPKYIREIADEFVKTVLGGKKFLSVHWRYDKEDWMKRCNSSSNVGKARMNLCKEASLIKPQDVAQAILGKIKSLGWKDIALVYIASPPSQEKFIAEVSKIIDSFKLKTYSLKDLTNLLNIRHKTCEFLQTHFNDIVSTTEMQICVRGTVFLRSTRSSWSSNVIEARRADVMPGTFPSKDEEIFSLATGKNVKRLKSSAKN